MSIAVLQSRSTQGGHKALEAALGQALGSTTVIKFGSNSKIKQIEEPIWEFGGAYAWPVVPDTLTVQSSSVEDSLLLSGVFDVHICGLDGNFVEVQEVLRINGTTPVVSANRYLRVNNVYSLRGASRYGQVGTITCVGTTTGDVLGMLSPPHNNTLQAMYTVPANKVAAIMGFSLGGEKNEQAKLCMWSMDNRDTGAASRIVRTANLYQSYSSEVVSVPYIIDEKHDVWMTGRALSNVNLDISAEFSMILFDRGAVPVVDNTPTQV